MGPALLLAASTTPAATDPNVPWWGKVLAGFIPLILGFIVLMAWFKNRNKTDEFDAIWIFWAAAGLMIFGGAIILWGLGAIDRIDLS